MAKRALTIRVAPYTIKRFQEYLNGESDRIGKLANDLAEDLAEYGAGAIQAKYDEAASEYAGVYDVKVEKRQTKKGNWSIDVKGESALHIEYGTGVMKESEGGMADWDARWYFSVKPGTPDPAEEIEESPYYKNAGYYRNVYSERAAEAIKYVDPATGRTLTQTKKGTREKVGRELVLKEGSGVTSGMPPQHCLQDGYAEMVDYFDEIKGEYF